jgi:hypothetical protein
VDPEHRLAVDDQNPSRWIDGVDELAGDVGNATAFA